MPSTSTAHDVDRNVSAVVGRVSRGLSATAELLNIVCLGRHCSGGREYAVDVDCT